MFSNENKRQVKGKGLGLWLTDMLCNCWKQLTLWNTLSEGRRLLYFVTKARWHHCNEHATCKTMQRILTHTHSGDRYRGEVRGLKPPVPAQAWVSRPLPRRTKIFPRFSGDFFLVVTLQQLPLCGPLYPALSRCNHSFTPTYKNFHYHIGPFHPVMGPFTPLPWAPPRSGGSWVVCAGSELSSSWCCVIGLLLNNGNIVWRFNRLFRDSILHAPTYW